MNYAELHAIDADSENHILLTALAEKLGAKYPNLGQSFFMVNREVQAARLLINCSAATAHQVENYQAMLDEYAAACDSGDLPKYEDGVYPTEFEIGLCLLYGQNRKNTLLYYSEP